MRLDVAAGRLALALDKMPAAGGDSAEIVDVARSVAGGALGQALRVADVSLRHVRLQEGSISFATVVICA
ncbi:hypothetical protein [Stenotrophomonas sp.]|uniref:hypothetical protein n=1 Tax=Stenotrophomonas sp. TaxID=69392 RepID=UPI00289F9D99|nr:hypothetical protein [Stenotrophomonas sp.]